MDAGTQDIELRLQYLNRTYKTINREPMDLEEPDCLIKTKQRDNLNTGLSSL